MIIIRILSYLSAGIGLVFSVFLCVYYLKPADSGPCLKKSSGKKAAGILLATAGLGFILNSFLFFSEILSMGLLLLSVEALLLIGYGNFSNIWTIKNIYPSSRLKVILKTPASIYNLLGLGFLAIFIITAGLLDLVKFFSIGMDPGNLLRWSIWALASACFLQAARMKQGRRPFRKPIEEEIVLSISDDVLVTRAYANILNRFLVRIKPFSKIIEEALLEYLEHNPILFQNCALTPEGSVDFKPAEVNIERITEEERVHQICTIFAPFCWRIINLYSALSSPKHSESVFAEGYREARDAFKYSPLFNEILRSLPPGILEDEKVVLLSKEELEARVRERTIELEKARDDQNQLLGGLRVAEANLRQVITKNADSMVIVDKENRVRFANPAAEALFGRKTQFWLGREFEFPIQADGLLEIEIKRESGETSIAEMRSVEIEWQDDLANLASIRDITDRKLTQTELLKSREALELSNQRLSATLTELKRTQELIIKEERLRALGQVASGIAHDFNNSLAPILGYTDLLLSTEDILDKKETVRKYLKIMNVAARDASNVVRRLREFYRKREKDELFKIVNLDKLVPETIDLTQPKWKDQALGRGVTVQIETDLQPVSPVKGNETELREALTNLIFNAADAIDSFGRITIRTYESEGNSVLEVSDTGSGMTEEVKQRCFDPFFSTKEERGTGLGLSVVYGTIERHNGQVEIESEYGIGTTISFKIPSDATVQATEILVKEEFPYRNSLRILVVEDEPMVGQILVRYLEVDNHSVEWARNGREGLEKFLTGYFDLVITDRAMPEMSGDQMASAIKKERPEKPILMITGFGDIMEARGESADVDLVLSKPFTLKDIRGAITKLVQDKGTPDYNDSSAGP